jgi:hypothetical protein
MQLRPGSRHVHDGWCTLPRDIRGRTRAHGSYPTAITGQFDCPTARAQNDERGVDKLLFRMSYCVPRACTIYAFFGSANTRRDAQKEANETRIRRIVPLVYGDKILTANTRLRNSNSWRCVQGRPFPVMH